MEIQPSVQPVFDPNNVAASLDYFKGQLTYRDALFTGQTTGNSSMKVRGEGTEFRNIRDYEPTDNAQKIDWRASARQPGGALQVRDFNRDISPNFFLVTDVLQSRYESMVTAEDYYSERNLALSACLGLLQIASKQGLPSRILAVNDAGLVGPSPLGRGSSHLLGVARTLANGISQPGDRTKLLSASPETIIERPRLADLLAYAGKHCANSVVAVVSDFRDTDPDNEASGWRHGLQALKGRKNSLVSVTINSPADFELPANQARFATEQGVVYIPTGKKGQAQRERYSEIAVVNAAKIDQTLESVRAQQIALSTADSQWASSFRRQLQSR